MSSLFFAHAAVAIFVTVAGLVFYRKVIFSQNVTNQAAIIAGVVFYFVSTGALSLEQYLMEIKVLPEVGTTGLLVGMLPYFFMSMSGMFEGYKTKNSRIFWATVLPGGTMAIALIPLLIVIYVLTHLGSKKDEDEYIIVKKKK